MFEAVLLSVFFFFARLAGWLVLRLDSGQVTRFVPPEEFDQWRVAGEVRGSENSSRGRGECRPGVFLRLGYDLFNREPPQKWLVDMKPHLNDVHRVPN